MKVNSLRIKMLLLEKNIGQQELADFLNVTRQTVNNWLSRNSIPNQKYFQLINSEKYSFFQDQEFDNVNKNETEVKKPEKVEFKLGDLENMYKSKIEILKNTIEDKQKIIELLEARIKELER